MSRFDRFKKVFNQIKDQAEQADVTGRVVRSIGAGGKAAISKGMKEFSPDALKAAVDSVYSSLIGEEALESLSRAIRSYDEEKIKAALDRILVQLGDEKKSLVLAGVVKLALKTCTNDTLLNLIYNRIPEDKVAERMVFKSVFKELFPVLDELRGLENAALAARLRQLMKLVPTHIVASQLANAARSASTDQLRSATDRVKDQAPTGDKAAALVEGLGNAALKGFDEMSKAKSLGEARAALKRIGEDSSAVIKGKGADTDAQAPQGGSKPVQPKNPRKRPPGTKGQ